MRAPDNEAGALVERIAAAFHGTAADRNILVTTTLHNAVWAAAYQVLVKERPEGGTAIEDPSPHVGPPRRRRARL